jgi:hypothetical protein
MGLAVVIVLVALGMFFVIRFTILKQPSTAATDYSNIQLSTNFINTLLETGVGDCRSSIKELMIDCAKGSPSISCANGDSCASAKAVTSEIMSNSLDKWGKKYEYNVILPSDSAMGSKLGSRNSGCTRASNRVSRSFFLPTARGTLTVKLDICT